MAFLLKKLLTPFLLPVGLCLEILGIGLILLWFTRRQRAGKIFASLGFLLLALFSCEGVGTTLLHSLEFRYPPLSDPGLAAIRARSTDPPPHWVVVLGGGYFSAPELPLGGQLSESSLARLVEGVRLHRRLPGSKLLLSGGSILDEVSEARGMARFARALGVDPQDMVLEQASRDTKDQAAFLRRILGGDRFILVTSAAHMPRSVALFRKQGLRPVPAPTDHWTTHSRGWGGIRFSLPSASALVLSEKAVHEGLGMAWARLRGQIE